MQIIPVLDVAGGAVVHARGGDRARYQPVAAAIGDGREPLALLAALRERYCFDTVYVADLDAISERGDNRVLIDTLAAEHQALEFWVDAGATAAPPGRLRRVVGSEYGAHPRLALPDFGRPASWVLSLDYRHDRLEGSVDFVAPEHWPHTVIVLDLDRVGSRRGAGRRHRRLMAGAAGSHRWVVGGGIRDDEELLELERDRVDAVLLASALYSGALANSGFARKKMPRTKRGIS